MARRWKDLSPQQRRSIVAVGVVEAVLKGLMLADLRRRSDDEVRGSKRWWAAGALLNTGGLLPVGYFLFGRRR